MRKISLTEIKIVRGGRERSEFRGGDNKTLFAPRGFASYVVKCFSVSCCVKSPTTARLRACAEARDLADGMFYLGKSPDDEEKHAPVKNTRDCLNWANV